MGAIHIWIVCIKIFKNFVFASNGRMKVRLMGQLEEFKKEIEDKIGVIIMVRCLECVFGKQQKKENVIGVLSRVWLRPYCSCCFGNTILTFKFSRFICIGFSNSVILNSLSCPMLASKNPK